MTKQILFSTRARELTAAFKEARAIELEGALRSLSSATPRASAPPRRSAILDHFPGGYDPELEQMLPAELRDLYARHFRHRAQPEAHAQGVAPGPADLGDQVVAVLEQTGGLHSLEAYAPAPPARSDGDLGDQVVALLTAEAGIDSLESPTPTPPSPSTPSTSDDLGDQVVALLRAEGL